MLKHDKYAAERATVSLRGMTHAQRNGVTEHGHGDDGIWQRSCNACKYITQHPL